LQCAWRLWCEWKGEQQDHHPHTDHRATMRVHEGTNALEWW
jgi:hypothetical protein